MTRSFPPIPCPFSFPFFCCSVWERFSYLAARKSCKLVAFSPKPQRRVLITRVKCFPDVDTRYKILQVQLFRPFCLLVSAFAKRCALQLAFPGFPLLFFHFWETLKAYRLILRYFSHQVVVIFRHCLYAFYSCLC